MTPRVVLPVLLLLAFAGCGDDSSGSTHVPDPAACKEVSKELKGLTLSQATERADKAGCPLRVVARDGEDLPVTQDFLEARINVKVDDDRVTSVDGLY